VDALGHSESDLFADLSWLERQAMLRQPQAGDSLSVGRHNFIRPTSLPLFLAGRAKSCVVDIGGGSGWVLEQCNRSGIDVARYDVVERSSVVDYFRHLTTKQLRFHEVANVSTLKDCQPLVLYSNSTLQYMTDDRPIMNLAVVTRPRFILLDELLLSTIDREWFSIQYNAGVPTVVRFINFQSLLVNLATIGYSVAWTHATGKSKRYSLPDMSHFASDLRIDSRLAVLLSRVGDPLPT